MAKFDGVRGLYATCKIPPGETLLSVPGAFALSHIEVSWFWQCSMLQQLQVCHAHSCVSSPGKGKAQTRLHPGASNSHYSSWTSAFPSERLQNLVHHDAHRTDWPSAPCKALSTSVEPHARQDIATLTQPTCRASRSHRAWALSLPQEPPLLATASQADMAAVPLFQSSSLSAEATLRSQIISAAEQVRLLDQHPKLRS